MNIIYCLTGWLPEQIPLNKCYDEQMWKLLLQLLPNWKLPQPTPPPEEHAGNSKSVFVYLHFSFQREFNLMVVLTMGFLLKHQSVSGI